jgi:hypothetical protein
MMPIVDPWHASTRLTFLIDLNSVTDDNRVTTLLGHSLDQVAAHMFALREGDEVGVLDDDGGHGRAFVVATDGRVLDLEIDWSSWQGPEAPFGFPVFGPVPYEVDRIITGYAPESQQLLAGT